MSLKYSCKRREQCFPSLTKNIRNMKMKLNALTLDEKIDLLTGKDNWQTENANDKLNSVFMADGPCGLRKNVEADRYNAETGVKEKAVITVKSTAYPALSVIANSWNVESTRLMADGIADDCIENDVDILLGPGVNIKRTPLCGRNFEYFSEDPYLAGELAYEYISALQKRGVGTSLKHFACNNAENYRLWQNSEVDERTFFEIYMPAFERALEAKPYTVMCSYNLLNGAYASENKWLLKEVLRDKFGFDGVIVSDWGAVHNRPRSLKATLDIEMPYVKSAAEELKQAYNDGYVTEAEIDESVQRIIALTEKIEKNKGVRKVTRTQNERHELAVKLAEDGIVMLKNNGILPLKSSATLDLYNDWASNRNAGGGSAKVESNYGEWKTLAGVLENFGYTYINRKNPSSWLNWAPVLLKDSAADYRIICVDAEYEGEGGDRKDIKLSTTNEELLIKLTSSYDDVIVIIFASSAVDCSAFKDKAAAIIFTGYAGEGQNEALANILTGKVNPSGKLAETFFNCLCDCPVRKEAEFGNSVSYDERVYVGYRYADSYGVEPAFAFGHGVSYSQFEYSNLEVKQTGKLEYEVSYDVKNVSSVGGKEISQVYVKDVICSSDRPEKELKAFSKDYIAAGETKRVTVKLSKRSFAFYVAAEHDFYVENGKFVIMVGAASDDIRLTAEIDIKLPEYEQLSPGGGRL